jgi:O-acetyl-ADP-ribose deacetylase (regulator of RNase III)
MLSIGMRLEQHLVASPRTQVFVVGRGTLEIRVGDITLDDSDAIVNPTHRLLSGRAAGLVDLALHRAAGPELAVACRAAARERTWPTRGPIITPGFALRARYVIHVVPPEHGYDPAATAGELASCYRRSLRLAYGRGLSSVAVPSIGTGALGHPSWDAAPTAIGAVVEMLTPLEMEFRVRFVLFGTATFEAYLAAADDALL